ncbi:MAG: FAD-dependent oxidoreductase [Lentisphaerae bacterium]|jgi:hypothetical protein|nr:FAD-dependent oxidoreductase [Lentisphaerota bacterium]MBT4817698.1 FAD-dependent oxidoreductase [Lentisphaerota bacterium]MBT5605531.1 FAD-dependent oxidoreductase [Lentisphaerota bacterium]MBT7056808.1 FAD-dependent oxidoreductase [Lentisphaerota bacterium]MBT7845406.1 FAD-dependent oxidoreductase [Lentisphaerota bacterium]
MTATIHEPAREIPVSHDVDVVVAGGGTAGVAAAVCAARLGLSVVMVERTAQPGGMVTHVTTWLNDFDNKGGFATEFRDHVVDTGICQWPYYNPYAVVPWFDQLLADAGVRPLYLASVVAPILTDGVLRGVIVESKSGRHAIRAKMVIDASGDGDVAARAGAASVVGRPSDGACQSVSLSHLWLNYQGGKLDNAQWKQAVRSAADAAGNDFRLEYDNGRLIPFAGTIPAYYNGTPHVTGYDPLDAESLSDLLITLRRQSMDYFDTMKGRVEGFENVFCGPFSGIPGVRETRRIVCDGCITVDQAREGVTCPDGLFKVTQAVDIHKCLPDEPPIIVERIKPYSITLGALLPRGLDNIAVAGRCIGGDHETLASYRIIADCFAMGEALAIACKGAIQAGDTLRDVTPGTVADEMQARGYE